MPVWACCCSRCTLLRVGVAGLRLGNRNDQLVTLGWVGILAVVALFVIRLKLHRARCSTSACSSASSRSLRGRSVPAARVRPVERRRVGLFQRRRASSSVDLVLPLMFLIGLDIASFALNIGEFGTHFVEDRFAGRCSRSSLRSRLRSPIVQTFFVLRDTFDEPHVGDDGGRALLPRLRDPLEARAHAGESSAPKDEEFVDAARSWAPSSSC